MSIRRLVSLCAVVLVSTACERVEDRDPAPVPPRIDPTPPIVPIVPVAPRPNDPPPDLRASAGSEAAGAIAAARCDREVRCGNVGAGETWTDTSTCVTEVRADWRAELSAYDCPGGIERDELAECLQEIRNEDCASPLDTLERVVACRSTDICNAT